MKEVIAVLEFIGITWGSVLVLVPALWWWFTYCSKHYTRSLEGDERSLQKFRERLTLTTPRARYLDYLNGGLGAAHRFFGTPLLGWKAFARCLQIALVYPIVMFLLAYLFSGSGKFSGFLMLPEWPLGKRLLLLVGVTVLWGGVWWLARRESSIQESLYRHFPKLWHRIGLVCCPTLVSVGVFWVITDSAFGGIINGFNVGLIILFILLRAGHGAFPALFSVTIAIVAGMGVSAHIGGGIGIAVVFASYATVAFSFAFLISFGLDLRSILVMGATIVKSVPPFSRDSEWEADYFAEFIPRASTHAGALASLMLLGMLTSLVAIVVSAFSNDVDDVSGLSVIAFISILPLLNALLDFLSWGLSRSLGCHLLKDNRLHIVVAFALLDLLAALLFLGLLAVLFSGAFTLVETWFNFVDGAPFAVADLLSQVQRDPWGEGLWILLMLLSTLVPTVIHFVFVIGSLVVNPLMRSRTDALEQQLLALEGHKLPDPELSRELVRHRFWNRWGIPSLLVFMLASVVSHIEVVVSWLGRVLVWAAELGIALAS